MRLESKRPAAEQERDLYLALVNFLYVCLLHFHIFLRYKCKRDSEQERDVVSDVAAFDEEVAERQAELERSSRTLGYR